jgi:hypothetical protein
VDGVEGVAEAQIFVNSEVGGRTADLKIFSDHENTESERGREISSPRGSKLGATIPSPTSNKVYQRLAC